MARTVFCQHFKKDDDGLDFQLYPGDIGKRIFDNILINEHKMNMMNPDDRAFLEKTMVEFLFEGKEPHIEGYTPEK